MRIATLIKATLPALLFTALFGCGSSGNGTMNVHLVDGPGDTYAKVSVTVKKLEIHGPGDQWQVLGDFSNAPKAIDDLQTLKNGIEELLVNGASLPEGHYDQMRMLLGSASVTLQGTTTPIALKVPSGMQTGIKFPVSFDVAAGTTRDVFIDFDANRSVFVHQAGMSGQYILRPVIHCVDKLVTGSISGTVSPAFAGALVMAETLDGSGNPSIVRTATTAADGSYDLNLLPAGATYYVVIQAANGSTVYAASASNGYAISEATPTFTYNPTLTVATGVGTMNLSVTGSAPGADQVDEVLVEQSLTLDGTSIQKTFIVRTVDASATSVPNLPAGTYTVVLERTTTNGDGSQTVVPMATANGVTVPGGGTGTATLSF